MKEKEEYAIARERMVEEHLRKRGIRNERVLQAMAHVPRHEFVPADMRHVAYADAPLPIGERQTISQPFIVAFMTEMLELKPDDRVLEIGTGSGYQAAVLAELARQVYSVERISELAERAEETLRRLGIENVRVFRRDGSRGLPEYAPYDGIIVTAAAPEAPQPLKDQLAEGGTLVLPVGGRQGQVLEKWIRRGERLEVESLAPVAFVPLLGDYGWHGDHERPKKGLRWF